METSPAFLRLLAEFRAYPAAYQWAGVALLLLPYLIQGIFCIARFLMGKSIADGMYGSRAPLTIYSIVLLALLLGAAYTARERSEVLFLTTVMAYFALGCGLWVAAGFLSGCIEGDNYDDEGQ